MYNRVRRCERQVNVNTIYVISVYLPFVCAFASLLRTSTEL